jgi:formylglycine-generating enzyme required for sulfatase activity
VNDMTGGRRPGRDGSFDERPTKIPQDAGDGAATEDLDNMRTVVPGMSREGDGTGDRVALEFAPGTVLSNRFEITAVLGRGGMGSVFKVTDRSMPGMVKALKVMLPSLVESESLRQRFVDEVRVAQRLTHRNVVRVHDLGQHGELQYFTMELVEGLTLDQYIAQRGGRLSLDETLRITRQMCDGLEEAHRSTVHRDLKPQNVMIQPDGTIKILDFGLAKLLSPGRRGRTEGPMGTAYYEAPEQRHAGAAVDPRADIYSLGVMLYEMLTGKLPTGMAKPPSRWNKDVPRFLDTLVDSMLQTDPGDRVSSVGQVRAALDGTDDTDRGQEPPVRKGSRLVPLAAMGVVVVVVALFLIRPVQSPTSDPVNNPASGETTPDRTDKSPSESPSRPSPVIEPLERPDPGIAHRQTQRQEAERTKKDSDEFESARAAMNNAKKLAEERSAAEHAAAWFAKGLDHEQKGDTFAGNDDIISAAASYRTAVAHYGAAAVRSLEAMGKIDVKRQTTELVLAAAREQRDRALSRAASEFASTEWNAAEKTLAEATTMFDAGDYDVASEQFRDAAKVYGQAATTAQPYVPEMLLVHGGVFSMGSSADEVGRGRDEGPVRSVTLSDYYLAAHEVTVAQFRSFVDKKGYITTAERGGGAHVSQGDERIQEPRTDANWRNTYLKQSESHPVTCISWHDAVAYCDWLGKVTGKTYRLPTEAEWEFACRSGTTTPFTIGSVLTSMSANFNGTYPYGDDNPGEFRKSTVPSKNFADNAWGFYNMHGNVAEWCLDWYADSYTSAGSTSNPTGPDSGRTRVMRGGGWNSMGNKVRSAARSGALPGSAYNTAGFRIARDK